MRAFVVMQWNGMSYDDSVDYPAAVFATLEEAKTFCKDTPAFYAHPSNLELPSLQAYSILEFEGAKLIMSYNADAVEK